MHSRAHKTLQGPRRLTHFLPREQRARCRVSVDRQAGNTSGLRPGRGDTLAVLMGSSSTGAWGEHQAHDSHLELIMIREVNQYMFWWRTTCL